MARPRKFNEEEVLDKAIKIFVQHGYQATSLSMLMESMGLQKGSIYKAFGDKRSLFMACLVRYTDIDYLKMRQCLEEDRSVHTALSAFLYQRFLHHDEDMAGYGCLMMNSMVELGPHDDEIRHVLVQQSERLENVFVPIFRQGQGGDEFRLDVSAETMAEQLTMFMRGVNVSLRLKEEARIVKDRCDFFMASIARQG